MTMTDEQAKQLGGAVNTTVTVLGSWGIIACALILVNVLLAGAMTYGVYRLAPPLIDISKNTEDTEGQTKLIATQTKDTADEVTELRKMEQDRQITTAQNQKTFEAIREAIDRLNDRVAQGNGETRKLSLSKTNN